MNAAATLTMTPAAEVQTTESSIEALLETTRNLIETTTATMSELDGKAKNDVAAALANLMNAVAKRIEG